MYVSRFHWKKKPEKKLLAVRRETMLLIWARVVPNALSSTSSNALGAGGGGTSGGTAEHKQWPYLEQTLTVCCPSRLVGVPSESELVRGLRGHPRDQGDPAQLEGVEGLSPLVRRRAPGRQEAMLRHLLRVGVQPQIPFLSHPLCRGMYSLVSRYEML